MRQAGVTLWELICTLAVAGIALAIAAPGFESFVLDTRRMSDVNALMTAIQLARSESAKRAQTVVLCQSFDLLRCGGGSVRFDSGWIVFVNTDGVRPASRSAGEPLLRVHEPHLVGTIRGNRLRFEFNPYRKRSTNGTVTFCDRRGGPAARAVIVSYTGRPRVSQRDASGRPLTCGTGS